LKRSETLRVFPGITIDSLQKNICDIQLIPSVPEEVKKVFNAAKRLYIFGYFEYYFFTISGHYAYLALESALRNRYIEVCGEPNPKKFVSLDIVIKKLVKKGIIRKGEADIYDAGRRIRNFSSHLTNPSINAPNSGNLNSVARDINQIYDKENDISHPKKPKPSHQQEPKQ